jgi:2,3-diketo-5-methylthiopentyl-1-phosphate enolase
MIKPCTGYPPEAGARFVRAVAAGGVDLVKDDELLADPAFSGSANGLARTGRAGRGESGDRPAPMNIANVTSCARDLEATAHAASRGADALMVNVLATA